MMMMIDDDDDDDDDDISSVPTYNIVCNYDVRVLNQRMKERQPFKCRTLIVCVCRH